MPDSLSRQLARWVVNLDARDLPPAVIDKMQTSLLHATVVSIIGAGTHHGRAAVDLALGEESSPDGATILANGGRATRCGAAFANSKLMHATNQADSYRMLTHPGPCVIPAALASAQLGGSTGAELITAMAAGYEVESRIAGDFIASTQARGFRSSPIFGTLGAAVATGKLLGLTEDQMVTAIALACTFTAGTNEGPRSGGREMMFHEPQSTRSGIMAALLAREDVRGSEEALEGPAGFYNAFTGNNRGELSYVFTGPDKVDFAPVTEGLGSCWELLHTVLKMYPTAGYNCPVIDLMSDIRSAHDFNVDDIEKITVDMNWLETLYPSPEFPNPSRGQAIVGSTHYFTAYVAVNGSYPPLRTRIDPGRRRANRHRRKPRRGAAPHAQGGNGGPPGPPRFRSAYHYRGGRRNGLPGRIPGHGTGVGFGRGSQPPAPLVPADRLARRQAGRYSVGRQARLERRQRQRVARAATP